MDPADRLRSTISSLHRDLIPRPTVDITTAIWRLSANPAMRPSPENREELRVKDSAKIVKQLTAVGLIIFEMIEATEDTYPAACAQLRGAAESLISLIESVIIDEHLESGDVIATPRFNVDVSFVPGYELEDLRKLTEFLNGIAAELPPGMAMSCSGVRESVHLARLFVLQVLRPNIREEGNPENPWDYLERTLGT